MKSQSKVEIFLKQHGYDKEVIYFNQSSATVPLAAVALGVSEAEIAKSLTFLLKEKNIVLVMCGTARVDNKKFKQAFGCKAKMATAQETLQITTYPVGGVCPFALPDEVQVYLDISLQRFERVFPAAGTAASAVDITVKALENITGGIWVDVAKEE